MEAIIDGFKNLALTTGVAGFMGITGDGGIGNALMILVDSSRYSSRVSTSDSSLS